MNIENLLTSWTKFACDLLVEEYNSEKVEKFDNIIHELSKVGVRDMNVYRMEDDGIIVRYIERGSKTFKKVVI